MSVPPRSVLVVGAGAFGVASALELARRGHRVRLIDPGPLPHPKAASTDISKMVRMDYGHDEFYMALGEQAMAAWDDWSLASPQKLFHRTGFLLLSKNPLVSGSFEGDSLRLLADRGHRVERLDRNRLAERFPLWSDGPYVDGYYNPNAGWIESGAAVAQVLGECAAAGVQLDEGRRVTGLIENGSRVGGVVLDGGERLAADVVVVAAGAWTPTLLPWLGDVMWTAAQPVFHYSISNLARFQAPALPPWAADLSNTGWYGFPALADGTLKIANHGPGLRVDPEGGRDIAPGTVERFRAFLAESLPELLDAPIARTRTCLYCDTFDSDFWVDEDPQRQGLIVATGGSGHGFKFLPVIGGIVADLLENVANPWAHRFQWRSLSDRRKEAARFMG